MQAITVLMNSRLSVANDANRTFSGNKLFLGDKTTPGWQLWGLAYNRR